MPVKEQPIDDRIQYYKQSSLRHEQDLGEALDWLSQSVFHLLGLVSDKADSDLGTRVNNIRIASKFPGTNAGIKITAAIADLPSTGGTVDARGLEGAQYVTATITIAVPVHLILGAGTLTFSGTGPAFSFSSAADGSILEGSGKLATVISVTNTAANGVETDAGADHITIRDLSLTGPGSGTGVGISVLGSRFAISRIIISSFGSDGFLADTSGSGNANVGILEQVRSTLNGGDGFKLDGTDSNLISFIGTDSVSNTGEGYNVNTISNVFVGAHSFGNATNGYHLGANSRRNSGTMYSENVAPETVSVLIDAGGANHRLTMLNGSSVVTDNGSGNIVFIGNVLRFSTGRLQFGSDVELLRAGADVLQLSDRLLIRQAASGTEALTTDVIGDSAARFIMTQAGRMAWGSGSAATDVGLSRTAANELSVAAGDTFRSSRYKALGTALVAGDFALSAGWGTTASIGTITGTDQRFRAIITSAGTGQAVNPTVILTFKDGTWGAIPFFVVTRGTGGSKIGVQFTISTTATTLTLTFQATPTAGETYTVSVIGIG